MATKKSPDEYSLLRDMILRGEVLPNQRLIEADYAQLLGTNRANIRKAFARLEQDGLVVSEHFKGTTVRRITEKEAVEITEARGALETLLIRQTVEHVTPADADNLRALVAQMRRTLEGGDAVAVGIASRAVRVEMWRIAGNTTVARLLVQLNSQLVRVWFQAILMPGRAAAIVSQMEEVVEAIFRGDADEAAAALRRYHDGSIASLKEAIRQRAA